MGANGRTTSTVGRGSISIVTLLLALPKLLLLPSLAGAFFAPIGVVSSSARSSSSAASSPGGNSKARTPSLGRHPDQAKGLFAGPNTSPGDETVGSGDMPPQNAGSSDNLGDDAAAQLLSAPSVAGDGAVVLGDVDGGVGDEREVVSAAGAVAEPEPALINVAKGKQGVAAATLWNVPNMLTMARVVAIPIFVALFYAPMPRRNVWCASIFAGAAFTDWLDGYIARRQGIVTPFGSFLDPVADKV